MNIVQFDRQRYHPVARVLAVASLSGLLAGSPLSVSAGDSSYSTHSRAVSTSFEDIAKVTQVEPVFETVLRSVPKETCWNEKVRRSLHHHTSHRTESATPVLLGAIIGGAIGNELGHRKRNKQVGTVVGGLLGGSIGRDISRASQDDYSHGASQLVTVRKCDVDYHEYEEQSLVGYDVTYRYRGREYYTQTTTHPGNQLRINVEITPAV